MDLWPSGKYFAEGKLRDAKKRTLQRALKQAHKVQKKGFPAIISLGHLARHTSVPYDYLRQIISRRLDGYRVFPVKKKPTGYRIICVPSGELLRVQRWIHRHILKKLECHSASQAYGSGCSPIRCAQAHTACKWLIKVDIRRFFESINEVEVYKVFRECGYVPLVSLELTRLTTRIVHTRRNAKSVRNCERYSLYKAGTMGCLPQGAPSSPVLANLVSRNLDILVQDIADEFGLTYTRYSDDLAFSTQDTTFSRSKALHFIRRIYGALNSFGFRPKTTKTKILAPGARHVVLGLTVNDQSPRLPRSFKRRLECHVYFIKRHGYVIHARERDFESAVGCYNYVQGLISYSIAVEKEFGMRLKAILDTVSKPF